MSYPRSIHKNKFSLIARRCAHYQRLLKPNKDTINIFMYCLAVAALRFGIGVVAVTVMGDHYRALYYDPHGTLPEFLTYFHRLVAVAMNCYLGRTQNFWASEQTCKVTCEGSADQFNKLIDVLTLPVTSHAVDRVSHWPGASSFAAQLQDTEVEFERPKYFFSEAGRMPARVKLRFFRPEGFAELTKEQWASLLQDATKQVEHDAAAERKAMKRNVVGRKAILRRGVSDSLKQSTSDGRLKPLSKWQRVAVSVREKVFRKQYAEAYKLLKQGFRNVLFPAGTYQLRVRQLVRCMPLPDSS